MNYISNALFIYDDENSDYLGLVDENEFGCICKKVAFNDFVKAPKKYKIYAEHVLSSCSNENLHILLQLVIKEAYTLSFLPSKKQKELIQTYALSTDVNENLEIALRDNVQAVDLIYCDNEYWHVKVHLGDTPLIQAVNAKNGFLSNLFQGLRQFFKLKLFAYDMTTANEKEIKTAASGLLILNHAQEKGLMLSY